MTTRSNLRNPASCEADAWVEGQENQTYHADLIVDEGARPPVSSPTNDGISSHISDIEENA